METLPSALYQDITNLLDDGDRLLDEGRMQEAVAAYDKALELVPEPREEWDITINVLVALGDANFKMKEYATAQYYYNKAMFCPGANGKGYVWFVSGRAHYELGDEKKAANALLSAYMLEGEDIFQDIEGGEKYFDWLKTQVTL